MLDKIKTISWPAYDYLVGDNGIPADKWRSTEWLRNKTLPARYGIVSMNSSKSSNSMYEEVRHLPWLYCLDTILNTMCTQISTLREANRDETGAVSLCTQTMESRWKESAGVKIIQLEPGGNCYKVSPLMMNIFQTHHVVDIEKKCVRVGCGKSLVFCVLMPWRIIACGQTKHSMRLCK
jgi:hypothetical protein